MLMLSLYLFRLSDQKGYLFCALIPLLLLFKPPVQDILKLGTL